jgi:hypothetical protein
VRRGGPQRLRQSDRAQAAIERLSLVVALDAAPGLLSDTRITIPATGGREDGMSKTWIALVAVVTMVTMVSVAGTTAASAAAKKCNVHSKKC